MLTCGPICQPIAMRDEVKEGEEGRERERGGNIGVFGTPLCIILQLLSINARIELVKIN